MGGSVYAVLNILMLENSMGMHSTVLCLKADGLSSQIQELATIKILQPSFPKRFSRSKQANTWLRENAVSYNLAIIHSIWGALPVEAAHILHNQKVPFVIWPHGGLDPFDLQKKKFLKKILGPLFIRTMLDKCSGILCTATVEADRLERYGSVTATSVLPLPIAPPPITGNRKMFREKFSLKDDDTVFLFLSLLYYKKGLDILIPSIKHVLKLHPNTKLVIAGSDLGGYEIKVRTWIEEYGLHDNVIMSGFLSGQDKYDAFAGCDCFVLPSMNENFGIAVVESLSAGLPVLISNNVYIWKEIIQQEGGWVCNYSLESLSETMDAVLKSPEDIVQKRVGAKKAYQIFSPEVLKESYAKLYSHIIASNAPRNSMSEGQKAA